MIQRKQSLFLLIAAIVSAILFFLPVASIQVDGVSSYDYYTTKVIQLNGDNETFLNYNIYSMILNIFISLLPLVTIFLYKNRVLQIRLCIFSIVLMAGTIAMMYLQTSNIFDDLEVGSITTIKTAMILPLISAILTFLAIKGISKDIYKLKSLDRIR